MIAHLRAEIGNGDARTDSPLVAKSTVGEITANLCGPAKTRMKALPNAQIEVCAYSFFSIRIELTRTEKAQRNPSPSRVDRNPVRCHPNRNCLDRCSTRPPNRPPSAAPAPSCSKSAVSHSIAGPPLPHGPLAIRLPRVSCRTPQPQIWSIAARPLRFSPLNQNPSLSDGFLASLAELANHDGIGNAFSADSLTGGAFD
jgi:hypothetical protein